MFPETRSRIPTALSLTQEFMGCTKCFGEIPVAGMQPAWPPRGWAGPDRVASPSVMVVSLNPGHPLKLADKGPEWDEEALLSRRSLLGPDRPRVVPEIAAREVLNLCRSAYRSTMRAPDLRFHKRSVAYARAVLWLLGVKEDWENHCWFTDIVKCSTVDESVSKLPQQAVANCATHLQRELAFAAPSVVVALGGDAEGPIRQALKSSSSSVQVIRLLHPSWWRKLPSQQERFHILRDTTHDPTSQEFGLFLQALQQELSG